MQKNNSKIIVIFFLLLFCGTVAAIIPILHADGFRAKDNSVRKRTSVRILSCFEDNEEKYELLLSLINNYMAENPDVSVSATNLTGDEFCVRLMTDFSASHEPDIVISAPNRDILSLYTHGKIADLTDILKNDSSWFNAIDKNALRFVSANDRIYGIPMETEYISLYINKKLFNDSGLAVPQTLDELKNTAATFRSYGVTPIAFGLRDKDMLLYQAIQTALEPSDAEPFYSEGALAFIKELYELGAFPSDCDSLTRKELQSLFVSGKCAMLAETSSFAGIIENQHLFENPPFGTKRINSDNFDIALFPGIKSFSPIEKALDLPHDTVSDAFYPPVAYGAGSLVYYVGKKSVSENREVTAGLLKYLTSPESSGYLYEHIKNMPAVSIPAKADYTSKLIQKRNSLPDSATEFSVIPQSKTDYYIWVHTFVPCVSDFIHDNMTAAELSQSIESRLSAINYR